MAPSDIFLVFILLNSITFVAALIIIFVVGYKKYRIWQMNKPPEQKKRSIWKRIKWK